MSSVGNSPFESAPAVFKMWTDMMGKMMGAGASGSAPIAPADAARELRDAMLKASADWWQQWLRSPEFLDGMRQAFDASVQMRRQFNDFLGQMHHDMQGVSRQDVDQLMRAMRHVERRAVDGLDRIAEQLEEIVRRLEALEHRAPSVKKRPSRHE